MDMLKKFFPHAFKATNLTAFIITLIVYILIDVVCGFVIGLLSAIPLLGIIFRIIGWVVDVYCLVGIVLVVLDYLKVLK